ncbi:hypothetical protein [Aeromonas veronii]|uniref:hypothetical protein n=1 Tax=Aeromonas veronii TaxID=654 RepID=UPI001315B9C5|nr:hypothetical protein [Aeromonas veronii]QHC09155.1 hypothetical protein GRF56_18010 [Aeromonas veronii]
MKRYFVIAGLLFLALTINIAWTGKAPWLGFWGQTATFVFGTLFTGVGMCIGEWFRRFTHPDWISTSGAVETFKAKIFWLMGPQAIGALIGFFAFQGFMNNILGYAV